MNEQNLNFSNLPQHKFRVREMFVVRAPSSVWSEKTRAFLYTISSSRVCRLLNHIDRLNLHFLHVSLLMALSLVRPSTSIQCLRKMDEIFLHYVHLISAKSISISIWINLKWNYHHHRHSNRNRESTFVLLCKGGGGFNWRTFVKNVNFQGMKTRFKFKLWLPLDI